VFDFGIVEFNIAQAYQMVSTSPESANAWPLSYSPLSLNNAMASGGPMLQIHSSVNGAEIHNLKNVLETNGISCEVRGESLRSAMGGTPMSESFVELWLLDDAQEEAARQILSGPLSSSSVPWTCPKCAEAIDAEFDQCWNCQASRPQ
jgi:hypothetical protein